MATYTFYVTETSYGSVEVEANTVEQAEELAYEKFASGNTIWGNSEVEITEEGKE